jgi:membrane-associated protease RseP (regulator of RpoE activity)
MISTSPRCGFKWNLMTSVLALSIGSVIGAPAGAQGVGWFGGGRYPVVGSSSRGYVPYYGTGTASSYGNNIYGNYGVYGYPGSHIEGGYSNPGYDPGYGGYPSYGGYGIISSHPTTGKRLLGIDEDPVDLPDGRKGMKIGKVYPGTAAEKAGLRPGDVIRSINGYLTEQRGNLAWIIANAAPNNELKITVQTTKDGQAHLVTAKLP